mgnify:CR=1 FL=1|jgi:dTDP-4-dehydrorhamnose 3,5-epimerase-like enzyme|tara:strand:- start:260 stop:655 length:396 start_codon:yes stop_codon:yes gene_type:complete
MSESFPTFKDERGTLVPIHFDKLAFIPKRIFYVKNVPKGEQRGCHAHYTTKQLLVCIQGEIEVKLDTGDSYRIANLKENESVFVDRLVWDSQIYKTGYDILMSIASEVYDESDYIRNYNKFLEIIKYAKKS